MTQRTDYQLITDPRQLQALCAELAAVPILGFDTEFVSEHSYHPELCLLQVVSDRHLALIDPLAVGDLTPFWQLLTGHGGAGAPAPPVAVVHGGREELLFCLRATGRRPARLVDLQVAAALVGHGYPIGFGALLHKLLGVQPDKGETRTDWRRRPLSAHQLAYAAGDVRPLLAMYRQLHGRLEQLGRLGWLEVEMAAWQDELEGEPRREPWRRVKGGTGMPRRSQAVLRALWQWREQLAQRHDCRPARVLRDDLLVELARRASADPERLQAIRGMERRELRELVPQLAQAIRAALELPPEQWPDAAPPPQTEPPQLDPLCQLLSLGMSHACRRADVAASLVATARDLRQLVTWRLAGSPPDDELPRLTQGWRAEVVGDLLDDLLAGRLAVRVANLRQSEPLAFVPLDLPPGERP